MFRNTSIFAFFISMLIVSSMAAAGGEIYVSDDFESGSLGVWRVEDDTRLVVTPRRGFDQDSVNTATTWFHGRLSNVLHRLVTIQFTGLEYGVYNGRRGTTLPFCRNTVPVFSYDREHWHRFSNAAFDSTSETFTISQIFSRDTVWVAYTVPYTFARLERFLTSVGKHPAVTVGTFGHSVQGRTLYMVDVTEPGPGATARPTAWIIARQHSFETGGSWAVQGLLEFLTSSRPEAVAIRSQVNFKLCPLVNPDGVTLGGTRFNARGVDLNRHWHSSDPLSNDLEMAPETALLRQAMAQAKKEGKLDLWINIHNNDMVWNEDGDYIRFGPERMEREAHRMEKILRQELVYTGSFNKPRNGQSTEAAVGEEFGCLCLLMEMKTGYLESLERWTGKDIFLSYGPGLARAAARYFQPKE